MKGLGLCVDLGGFCRPHQAVKIGNGFAFLFRRRAERPAAQFENAQIAGVLGIKPGSFDRE
jgi:hypothetical protein